MQVTILKREIEDTEREYACMMAELELLDRVKEENKVNGYLFCFSFNLLHLEFGSD